MTDSPGDPAPADPPHHVLGRQLVVGAVTLVLVVVMLCLGVWQMSVYRHQGRLHLEERSRQAPVPLSTYLSRGNSIGSLYGLPVTMTGHYAQDAAVLVGTAAPFRVVSPFVVDGHVVAVVRGTVTSVTAPLPSTPSGTVTRTGILMPSESTVTGQVPTGAPSGALPGVQVERLTQRWPTGVVAGFVTLQTPDAEGLAAAQVTFPDDASGKAQNLGYAMQWWVFAFFAAAMGVVVIRSIGRRSPQVAEQ